MLHDHSVLYSFRRAGTQPQRAQCSSIVKFD
jgi:hypothetical protein